MDFSTVFSATQVELCFKNLCNLFSIFLSSPKDIFFPFYLHIEWEGGTEREKHQRERDTSTGCLLQDPDQGQG